MPYKLRESKEIILPGDEPRTVLTIEPMTDEQWSLIEAANAREQNALRRVGRDPDDGDAIRAMKVMEYDAIAGAVSSISNYPDAGSTITDRKAIVEFISALPVQVYRVVRATVLQQTAVSDIEGKV